MGSKRRRFRESNSDRWKRYYGEACYNNFVEGARLQVEASRLKSEREQLKREKSMEGIDEDMLAEIRDLIGTFSTFRSLSISSSVGSRLLSNI